VREPSSPAVLGGHVKAGRRGSLVGKIVAKGVQGHAAYLESFINPNRALALASTILQTLTWDDAMPLMPAFTPPLSFQGRRRHCGISALPASRAPKTALPALMGLWLGCGIIPVPHSLCCRGGQHGHGLAALCFPAWTANGSPARRRRRVHRNRTGCGLRRRRQRWTPAAVNACG
jgi:acetylornithine deacetylase/succinyl-diaminopimelate desuccinylase-like protein